MNKQTAIGLIVGFAVAINLAWITSNEKYYAQSTKGWWKEVTKSNFKNKSYPFNDEGTGNFKKEVQYNSVFIWLGLIGGIGAGYLLGGIKLETQES